MQALPFTRIARANSGFTLVELMIAVAIIGILTAIILPSYRSNIISGDITEATNTLSSLRAQMEQYYQDNRVYSDVSTTILSPCDTTSTTAGLASLNGGLKYFTISCTINTPSSTVAPGYVLTATGISTKVTTGFSYTLDNNNNKTSTMGAAWGSTSCASSWKTSKSGGC